MIRSLMRFVVFSPFLFELTVKVKRLDSDCLLQFEELVQYWLLSWVFGSRFSERRTHSSEGIRFSLLWLLA